MIGQAENLLKMQHLLKNQETIFPNAVCFSSGKGGTGKSFIALNTAWMLSEYGKKVLLMDLDSNSANLHLMLNHIPTVTLHEYTENKKLFSEVITTLKKNLDIIYGISEYTETANLGSSVKKGISRVHREYDFVILDMGPGITDFAMDIIPSCSTNVIVTTPEPTAVMDAYALVKMLKLSEQKGSNCLVVNKCSEKDESRITYENLNKACTHFLKTAIKNFGEISYDSLVMTCIKQQKLLVTQHPDNGISAQIRNIVELLLNYSSVGHY